MMANVNSSHMSLCLSPFLSVYLCQSLSLSLYLSFSLSISVALPSRIKESYGWEQPQPERVSEGSGIENIGMK